MSDTKVLNLVVHFESDERQYRIYDGVTDRTSYVHSRDGVQAYVDTALSSTCHLCGCRLRTNEGVGPCSDCIAIQEADEEAEDKAPAVA